MSTNPYQSPETAVPPVRPPGDAVGAPAITLMVLTGISLAFLMFGIVANLLAAVVTLNNPAPAPGPPFRLDPQIQLVVNLAFSVVFLCLNVLMLFAAIRMRQLRNCPLALSGAILAAKPCLSPCYCLGIPVGIWAIIVLSRPEVKAAFDQSAHPPAMSPFQPPQQPGV